MHTCDYESPLGRMLLAADDTGLTGAWFYGQRYFARGLDDVEKSAGAETPVLAAALRWLEAYFAGERPDVTDVPLAPRGTSFQRRVWSALLAIPYGETRTYGELAVELGSSARAVGAAVGKNPISVVVPCHRVLGANGSLTGYAGGLTRKQALLELESETPPRPLRCADATVLLASLSFSRTSEVDVRRNDTLESKTVRNPHQTVQGADRCATPDR